MAEIGTHREHLVPTEQPTGVKKSTKRWTCLPCGWMGMTYEQQCLGCKNSLYQKFALNPKDVIVELPFPPIERVG